MTDLLFILVTATFFALCAIYARALDKV